MEDFENEIDKVLSGEINLANSHELISPNKVDEYLKSVGCKEEDFESNGWDWDFWMTYSKDGKKFILAGSGWYNNGLSFSKSED